MTLTTASKEAPNKTEPKAKKPAAKKAKAEAPSGAPPAPPKSVSRPKGHRVLIREGDQTYLDEWFEGTRNGTACLAFPEVQEALEQHQGGHLSIKIYNARGELAYNGTR